jgi:hypothetical protein
MISGKLCKFAVVCMIMAYNVARVVEQVASWDSKWALIFNSILKTEAV